MRVMPLGTSSARPTIERNVSSAVLESSAGLILIDCGEGTQHRLLEYGVSAYRLQAILITHLHGDHVLGLPGLLGSLSLDNRQRPLKLLGPTGLSAWVGDLCERAIIHLTYPLDVHELVDEHPEGDGTELIACPAIGNVEVQAIQLHHRVASFGYRLTEPTRRGAFDLDMAAQMGLPPGPLLGALERDGSVLIDGREITIDQVTGPEQPGTVGVVFGDTTACPSAAVLASHADLVIHEATYQAEDASHAATWLHSTSVDAAKLARNADIGILLLTHFSSRYGSTDRLVEQARSIFPNTWPAQEGVWVDVPNLRPPTES